jgi:hypothetical protein
MALCAYGSWCVQRETRQRTIASFDDYWVPIEAGTGQLRQAYLALPAARRQAVREEVAAGERQRYRAKKSLASLAG